MNTARYSIRTFGLEIAIIVIAAVYAFPLYTLVVTAFKTPQEAANSPLALPSTLSLSNFVQAWNEADLGSAILNSVIITVVSVAVVVLVSSMAGYFIARWTNRWSGRLLALFLLGLIVPFQLALIPLYQLMRDMHLLGTHWAVIVYGIGSNLSLSIFLYTGFLRSLGSEYEEAAMIDGATPLRAFWLVVFPLMKPITGTVLILSAIDVWNAFLVPNLFLSGTGQETIPVAIFSFVGEFASQWHIVFAGLLIGLAPILIAFLAMQQRMIQGFAGGLKG
ncbi:sugar ABC transporter permease [Microbacterium nanhaiense]|uniref:Sugar ABC transporter permease n=1 Tax=Microbacterium nanhaiense TaxID=1301026 RepID=A0ABQ2N289_9MICO|nr:carbohydrate ABC transporter permease [Microbacterium nanhaiense]GGO65849.1 sugar ABC transporter permease [Microbacterium nanhaiense]